MPATTTTAASDGGVETTSLGKEAIRKLKSTDPPLYLSPTPDLSESARLASEYLFSSLKPYAHKSPFSHLLVKGFDAEQIWQQIDIQSQPLISSLRRKVQNFEKNPGEIKSLFNSLKNEKPIQEKAQDLGVNGEIEDFEDEDLTAFGDEDDEDEDDEEEEEEEEEDEDEEEKLLEKSEERGIEDKFLKINELEDYLETDEAKEYGIKREKKKGKKRGHDKIAEGDEEEHEGAQGGEEDEDDEDEDGDELGLMGLDDDDDEDDGGENARYNDFFVGNKGKTTQKRKNKSVRVSDNLEMDEGLSDDDNNQKNAKPSTHERELERRRSTIEEMEKANIEPKSWTMLGEVTAAKRPKNSALGVSIDFEQNAKPAPVTTIEYDGSLEDMITKRATERGYDDIEKPPSLPSRAPREVKELDENKSKKGLGDIYEEEYAEKTGLVSVAVSLSEQQKKEAKLLFKELCLKLDALSHFHFTPKPVIEDMSIQTNVPAFAMEEIAPVAVSDAAMLAPEEVFAGKGDIKDETELTQAERKRRRANKKRKFKANEAKKVVKSQPAPQSNIDENDS